MSLLSILSALAAFLAFALSTDGHHRKWFGGAPKPERRRRLRVAAWLLVSLCLVLAFAAKGWVYGAIFWLGALSFGAAAVFLLLNLMAPRTAP